VKHAKNDKHMNEEKSDDGLEWQGILCTNPGMYSTVDLPSHDSILIQIH
jgi:hypothetical protein